MKKCGDCGARRDECECPLPAWRLSECAAEGQVAEAMEFLKTKLTAEVMLSVVKLGKQKWVSVEEEGKEPKIMNGLMAARNYLIETITR